MANQTPKDAETANKPLKRETYIFANQSSQSVLETSFTALGVPLSTAAMVRYLDGLASYWQVRDWRRGRSTPSRKALDYLAMKLNERAANYEGLAAVCRRLEPGVSQPNILAWNARRRS